MAVVTGRNPAGPQCHRSVRVPGIFAAWHRGCAIAELCGPVEREFDPRFDPDDMPQAESDEREADYRRAIAEAMAAAETVAAQRIAEGKPIKGTLLSPRLRPRNVPLLSDPAVMVDIDCDDRVSVNVTATAEHQAKRAADLARRATVVNRNGRNGNAVNITSIADNANTRPPSASATELTYLPVLPTSSVTQTNHCGSPRAARKRIALCCRACAAYQYRVCGVGAARTGSGAAP